MLSACQSCMRPAGRGRAVAPLGLPLAAVAAATTTTAVTSMLPVLQAAPPGRCLILSGRRRHARHLPDCSPVQGRTDTRCQQAVSTRRRRPVTIAAAAGGNGGGRGGPVMHWSRCPRCGLDAETPEQQVGWEPSPAGVALLLVQFPRAFVHPQRRGTCARGNNARGATGRAATAAFALPPIRLTRNPALTTGLVRRCVSHAAATPTSRSPAQRHWQQALAAARAAPSPPSLSGESPAPPGATPSAGSAPPPRAATAFPSATCGGLSGPFRRPRPLLPPAAPARGLGRGGRPRRVTLAGRLKLVGRVRSRAWRGGPRPTRGVGGEG